MQHANNNKYRTIIYRPYIYQNQNKNPQLRPAQQLPNLSYKNKQFTKHPRPN